MAPYAFVDRYAAPLFALILLLLILTIADGLITMVLIGGRCEEANPLMAHLIRRGPLWFVLIKYAMTAVGMPVLLLFKDHGLFGTRFRVVYLIPAFVALYLLLLVYQLGLLRADPDVADVRERPVSRPAAPRPGGPMRMIDLLAREDVP